MVKKSDIKSIVGSRRVASIEPGTYQNLPAFLITLESKEVGAMSKERFNEEVDAWGEDADGCLIMPNNYRLSARGYWTTLERPGVGASGFKFAGTD